MCSWTLGKKIPGGGKRKILLKEVPDFEIASKEQGRIFGNNIFGICLNGQKMDKF